MVGNHPIDPCYHTTPGARPTAVENPHGDETYTLGHTIRCAANRTGDVGAVAIAVVCCSTINCIVPARRPTTKLVVRESNTGVNDIGFDPGSRPVVGVGLVQEWIVRTMIDAVQPPGCPRLGGDYRSDTVRLNSDYPAVTEQALTGRIGNGSSKAVERVGVHVIWLNRVLAGYRRRLYPFAEGDDKPTSDGRTGRCRRRETGLGLGVHGGRRVITGSQRNGDDGHGNYVPMHMGRLLRKPVKWEILRDVIRGRKYKRVRTRNPYGVFPGSSLAVTECNVGYMSARDHERGTETDPNEGGAPLGPDYPLYTARPKVTCTCASSETEV